MRNQTHVTSIVAALVALIFIGPAWAQTPCEVADNGTGTITLPPAGCEYLSPQEVHEIIDGLPAGTTIELDPIHWEFFCQDTSGFCSVDLGGKCESGSGMGTLGGQIDCFESYLQLDLKGTGDLAGFNRLLSIPVVCEVHTGPRNPGDPVQTFDTDMFRLQGQLLGDPDFDLLRVTGGTDFGLASPGQTTLTDLGGGIYNVDSFFDITYRIEFQGAPGSVLDGYAGVTTAAIKMQGGVPAQSGNPCVVPDNGTGTVTLPPRGCEYLSPDEVHEIIDGLPAGTTIELDPIHLDFICRQQTSGLCSMPLLPGQCETEGGSLGGHGDCFESTLDLIITGTGELEGFNRHIAIPVGCEVHTGPRNPGDPVQTFDSDMFRLQGEILGDPDFDLLRVTGGTDLGLPSPGQTTLTDLGDGNFNVDSFFDITYQIEFQGAPGSQLDGMAGTTTATIRMETGNPAQTDCSPLPDGSGCEPVVCPDATETCLPRCQQFDPATGNIKVIDCECRTDDECHPETPPAAKPSDPCVPEGGTAAILLPPEGCQYISPNEVHEILAGLPPGTTVVLDPIHAGFFNVTTTPGGNLGGEIEIFDSNLHLKVEITQDDTVITHTVDLPLACEVHTGPRNPGDPVQEFDNEMVRLQGQMSDGVFESLEMTAGSGFDLPSSLGETTLTQLPSGDFAVDSFFDITYQIEFVGAPGGPLADLAGTSQATLRMRTGAQRPTCVGGCPAANESCVETVTTNADGTIDVCCDCVTQGMPYAIEFSLDIGSDTELSDPFMDGDEVFDPGDVYMWQGPSSPLPRNGFKDDKRLIATAVFDPPPEPGANNPVPVGTGGPSLYPDFFDLDGHDQIDVSLQQFIPPDEPLTEPIAYFNSACIYNLEYLAISYDDDMRDGWPVPLPPVGPGDVPVTVPSPGGMIYGTTMGMDEVIGVQAVYNFPGPNGYSIGFTSLIADELSVHVDMAPNPDCGEQDDDDVDSLDAVPPADQADRPCQYWLFSADHEANYGLDPGDIYELSPVAAGPVRVIDDVIHLGLRDEVDIDAFELVWTVDQAGTQVLMLLFSVDDDDQLTQLRDESGGLNPRMLYGSFMTGSYFPVLNRPLDDDVDALTNWKELMDPPPHPVPPEIVAGSWRSVKFHGGPVGGPLPIPLDEFATIDPDTTTEPRVDGLEEVRVDFTEEVQIVGPVIAQDLTNGISYPAIASLVNTDKTLVMRWNPGLPNLTCYYIDLSCAIISKSTGMWLSGDTDCYVATLEGDTNDDHKTDALDRGQVKVSELALDPATLYPRRDVNLDGKIDALDRGAVKVRELLLHKVICP